MFSKNITSYETNYGLLFYNDDNKDSFDLNHAIIYKNKINNIEIVLIDIINFYKLKNIRPCIYQSINEEGYFDEIKNEILKYGFDYWNERKVKICYLWPDGETAEKIHHEAGFRTIKVRRAGRAIYKENNNI